MSYTTGLLSHTRTIFEGEDYIEQLKKAAELFRTFDKALDNFIVAHGYIGVLDDTAEKVQFIADKCRKAGVPVPRNIAKWYSEGKRIERSSNTPFQLCFAFGLTVEEADDFLRRICLARGFDCHSVREVVYFYALKEGLSYQQASDMIERIHSVEPVLVPKVDYVYTDLIVEELEEIESPEALVSYLNENIEKFGYNNATAYETIQSLWEEISKVDGLALREKKKLYKSFDREVEEPGAPEYLEVQPDEGAVEAYSREMQPEKKLCRESVDEYSKMQPDEEAEDRQTEKKPRKERKREDKSRFEMYLQILGLAGTYAKRFYEKRSLKDILTDNELLHPLAADCFPDRDGLNKVLNREHISYERVRKLLILLVFYRFWASRALKRGAYAAGEEEGKSCIAAMNDHLISAGYPELYAGNPYDFLMLAAAQGECPLLMFRDYMQELYFAKVDLEEPYESKQQS